MFAALFVLAWGALIAFILIANKRWCDRMERSDKEMEASLAASSQALHKSFGRKYG